MLNKKTNARKIIAIVDVQGIDTAVLVKIIIILIPKTHNKKEYKLFFKCYI